jgi:hypothetical protein
LAKVAAEAEAANERVRKVEERKERQAVKKMKEEAAKRERQQVDTHLLSLVTIVKRITLVKLAAHNYYYTGHGREEERKGSDGCVGKSDHTSGA